MSPTRQRGVADASGWYRPVGMASALSGYADLSNEARGVCSAISLCQGAGRSRQIRGGRAANHVNIVRTGGGSRIDRQGIADIRPTPAKDVFRIVVHVLRGGIIGGRDMRNLDVDTISRHGGWIPHVRAGGRVIGSTRDDDRAVRQDDKIIARPVTDAGDGGGAVVNVPVIVIPENFRRRPV